MKMRYFVAAYVAILLVSLVMSKPEQRTSIVPMSEAESALRTRLAPLDQKMRTEDLTDDEWEMHRSLRKELWSEVKR